LGEAEPTTEEVEAGEAITAQDKEDEEGGLTESMGKLSTSKPKPKADDAMDEDEEEVVQGVPQFWLTALRNHVELQSLITERDEEALGYLTDVRCVP
jgi:nucleosome assembly protein 1-like 1